MFVIQRGAADGLGALAPLGDPAFAGQRGVLAEDFAQAAKLGTMSALHPALRNVAAMYAAKEALFAHAVTSPYRGRPHFDGQNVLETGGGSAYSIKDGWLNRLLALLPRDDARGVAVASYAPSALPDVSDDLLARVSMLNAGDPQPHALWKQATATRMLTSDMAADAGRNAAATATLAARLLTDRGGARIAMIETGGWDTHARQRGRLMAQLRGLDGMIAALKQGLGPHWANTMVLVATEFGRTVRINGTQGADHGAASMAMLLGGAVQGGRVIADWPGLSDAALYEGRDLRPTMALDALIGSAVAGHFGIDPSRAMTTLFPEARRPRLIDGLTRA